MANLRVAMDVGGTFTDICILDADGGEIEVGKVPSTTSQVTPVTSAYPIVTVIGSALFLAEKITLVRASARHSSSSASCCSRGDGSLPARLAADQHNRAACPAG